MPKPKYEPPMATYTLKSKEGSIFLPAPELQEAGQLFQILTGRGEPKLIYADKNPPQEMDIKQNPRNAINAFQALGLPYYLVFLDQLHGEDSAVQDYIFLTITKVYVAGEEKYEQQLDSKLQELGLPSVSIQESKRVLVDLGLPEHPAKEPKEAQRQLELILDALSPS